MMLFGIGAGLVLVIAAAWAAQRAAGAVGNIAATTLNPASSQNFVYEGISGVGSAVAGSPWYLSDWVMRFLRPDLVAAEQAALAQTPPFNPRGATGGW